jgi:hypothetical protein
MKERWLASDMRGEEQRRCGELGSGQKKSEEEEEEARLL